MHKKLMMACMAIAAFAAFAMPSAASASPTLTDLTLPGGVVDTVKVGSWVVSTNVGVTKFTGSVTVECSSATLKGTVTENSGSSFKGEIEPANASFTGTATGGDCTSTLFNSPAKVTVNSKLCLASVKGTDNVTTTGCGKNVSFTLTLTGNGPCKYETSSVSGSYVTNTQPNPAEVTVSEQESKLVEGGFFCPSSGKLDMVFKLETTDGSPVFVS